MKPVGIFGGTFDPVHFGHLRAAVEIIESFELQELRLVPCGLPPLKEAAKADGRHRVNMLQLAIKGQPGISIDEIELTRQGPSYTIDTVASIRKTSGGASSILFLGSDAFAGLHQWHRWQELLEMTHIVVLHRPGMDIQSPQINAQLAPEIKEILASHLTDSREGLYSNAAGKILMLPLRQFFISSSEIRQMVHDKKSIRYLLPENVLDYILTEKFYI